VPGGKKNLYRIFGVVGAPLLLPAHVPEKLVLGEICYQTILQVFNASLVRDKKRLFIPYGFFVGYHFVKDTTQARQDAQNQIEYSFFNGRYKRHNPKKLVVERANKVVSHWPYEKENFEDEIFTKNALN